MPGPEVAEAPAIGALLASLALVLAYGASTGLLTAWRHSLGNLLTWLADQVDAVRLPKIIGGGHVFGVVASLLRALDRNVDAALGAIVEWSGKGAALFFRWFLSIQLWIVHEIADLATDVWHGLANVEQVTVTRVQKVVTHTVTQPITKRVTIVKETGAQALSRLTSRVHALEAQVSRVAHAIPHALPSPFPRIGRLEREAEAQAGRLSRLEKLSLSAAGAAVTLAALKRFGLGWLRCNNVGRLGKRACSLDTDLLESLLGASLLLTSAISIEQLARELQEPTELVTDGLKSLIREF